jgi:hypothetical protein
MSVDSRLREALERNAADFVPSAPGSVDAIITRARRRRAGRRVAAGAAVVLALAVGLSIVVGRQSGSAAPPPVPAASASPTRGSTTPGPAQADTNLAADLVGTWTTGVVSPQMAQTAMARTGTAAYRDSVLRVLHLPGTITLTFEDLAYRAQVDGEPVDEGTWSVRNGKLVLVPFCTTSCRMVLGPDLHEGALNLALLEDDSPDVDRVPDAAHATVIYGSAPFHRPR